MSEHGEQSALFTWSKYWETHIPELTCMFAIPNAQKFGTASKQQKIHTINRMKNEGLQPGIPDICLPLAIEIHPRLRGILFIEMKYGKNKASENQVAMAETQAKFGNSVYLATNWKDAAKVILDHVATYRIQTSPVPQLQDLERAAESLKEYDGPVKP